MTKRIIEMVLAVLCLALNLNAQQTRSGQVFEQDPSKLKHKFTIHLANENKVVIELSSMDQLPMVMNLDSILSAAIKDIAPLQDSMQNALYNYSIIYVVDTIGNKKINIIQHLPKGENYIVKGNDVSSLKLEQDTLSIIILDKKLETTHYTKEDYFKYDLSKGKVYNAYCKVTFLVNNLADIPATLNGTLNQSMNLVASEYRDKTKSVSRKPNQNRIEANYYPFDKVPGKSVYLRNYPKAFISLPYVSFGMQNIYDKLATSVSLGVSISFQRGDRIRHFIFAWEPLFLFNQNSSGKFIQHRNDFNTLSFISESLTAHRENLALVKGISLSFLRKQRGDYFEKNTFKAGFSGVEYRGLSIQPQVLFNDFFKNVSPGLKFSFTF